MSTTTTTEAIAPRPTHYANWSFRGQLVVGDRANSNVIMRGHGEFNSPAEAISFAERHAEMFGSSLETVDIWRIAPLRADACCEAASPICCGRHL